MRFKFEEKAKIGTLYLLGLITENDKSEFLSLLEKTTSMCLSLKIDISGVTDIPEEFFGIVSGYTDIEIVGDINRFERKDSESV